MLEFKKIQLEDKNIIKKYIYPYNLYLCDYAFSTLYLWRDAFDTSYAILDDALILRQRGYDGKYFLLQPMGCRDDKLKVLTEKLISMKEEIKIDFLYKDLDENFTIKLNELFKDYKNKILLEDRNNFDYIYDVKKMMNFSGKAMHKKKNHFNHFVKNYNYLVKKLDKSISSDIIDCAEMWYQNKNDKDIFMLYELNSIKEAVFKLDELDLTGIAVYVNDKIAGFSIGNIVNDKLGIVHIEKADNNYNGIYSFISSTMAQKCFYDLKYINREDDMGNDNLRKSKLSYGPIKLEKKFSFDLRDS